MRYNYYWCLIVAILWQLSTLSAQSTIYVRAGASGTGTSWVDATELQQALNIATYGTQIWVAEGTYLPMVCDVCTPSDRANYFQIPNGVQVYGGFAGTETSLEERLVETHTTILSGDIDQDNSPTNNSFTLVYTKNVDSTTLLDGFVLENAHADVLTFGYGAIENSGAAWYNDGSESSIGSHPTIRHCVFRNNRAAGFAGAILNKGNLYGSANPLIEYCRFENNEGLAGGGAIYNLGDVEGNSSPTIRYCNFVQNSTQFDGGAIVNEGIDHGESHPTIAFCLFEANRADKHGGAIHNFGKGGSSSPIIHDCTFRQNVGDIGGGIYNDGSFDGASFTEIINCDFIENEAGSAGGAMYNLGSEGGNCSPVLYNLLVKNNHSQGAGAGIFNNAINGTNLAQITNCIVLGNAADTYGGGIYNLGKSGNCSPTITNCIVAKNTALSAGGMYNLGSEGGNSSPIVTNCTFYGNTAIVGGGIYCNATDVTGNSSPVIRNTIIYGNQAEFGAVFRCIFGTPDIAYSLVDKADCVSINSGTGSNVQCGAGMLYNVMPLFEDAANNDFHLQLGSPLIDKGSNDAVLDLELLTDLDSLLRINNGIVDIGAYEYNAVTYVPPNIVSQSTDTQICEGTETYLSVFATGTPPLSFQWFKNDIPVQGASTDTLYLPTTVLNDSGTYTCRVTSSINDTIVTSPIQLTVSENVNAHITVEATKDNICAGEQVSFTALTENAGNNAAYDWIINGMSTGVTTATFETENLQDGDIVGCLLTSDATCVQNNPAISNAVTMTVHPVPMPQVSISATETAICAGDLVLFDVQNTFEGDTPSYEWLLNGEPIGVQTPSFSTTSLIDGDVVACVFSTTATCLETNTFTSNAIVMEVTNGNTPSVAISASTTSFCLGETITFLAEANNTGNGVSYQWLQNGILVGTDDAGFSGNTFADGDIIQCVVQTEGDCLTDTQAFSNEIILQAAALVTPTIEIVASEDSICAGEQVVFTASTTHEGDAPSYQWLVNDLPVGETLATFSTNDLQVNDEVTCQMTSTNTCVTTAHVLSNSVFVEVLPTSMPDISIAVSADTVCAGEQVVFTASVQHEGSNPYFIWEVNGSEADVHDAIFTLDNIQTDTRVRCRLTSSLLCASPATQTSNIILVKVLPSLSPAISVQTVDTLICEGTLANFSTVVTNGGIYPSYQWFVNDMPVGENSPFFQSATLQNGAMVTCQLTSSARCTEGATVLSDPVTVFTEENVHPEITIVPSQEVSCYGEEQTFTASIQNGGANPQLDWYWNDHLAATNVSTFTLSGLSDGDIIECTLTPDLYCSTQAMVSSNPIEVTINPLVQPTVAVFSNETAICAGDPVLFFTENTYAGDSPIYEWLLNGTSLGIHGDSFTIDNLQDGDLIQCRMTSTAPCAMTSEVLSSPWEVQISESLTATVGIVASHENICLGNNVVFEALPVNGGSNPDFAWFINNVMVSNGVSFETENLLDGDIVQVQMWSSATCVENQTTTSEPLNMTVQTPLMPLVSIRLDNTDTLICPGDTLYFTALPASIGDTTHIYWYINGNIYHENTPTIQLPDVQANDVVQCSVQSFGECIDTTTVYSQEWVVVIDEDCTNSTTALDETSDYTIFPNPTNGMFYLTSDLDLPKEKQVRLFDAKGVEQPIRFFKNANRLQADGYFLPAGVYFVRVYKEGYTTFKKIVVQR